MSTWYATIQPGLEPVLAEELGELGFSPQAQPGGVRFEATPDAGAALAWTLRTPSSLLVELAGGSTRHARRSQPGGIVSPWWSGPQHSISPAVVTPQA